MFSECTPSSVTVKQSAKLFIPDGDQLVVAAGSEYRDLGIFILTMAFLPLNILELEFLI